MSLYRPVKIGLTTCKTNGQASSLELPGNLFLAPVAGYTDRAFRSLCIEQGACFSFTELVSAEALYRNFSRYGLDDPASLSQYLHTPETRSDLSSLSPNLRAPEPPQNPSSLPPCLRASVPLCESFSNKPSNKSLAINLIRRAENETHYAIQLFGAQSESIYKAAVLLAPLRPDALDINAGCPVPKVVKNGAGSALMKNPANIGKITEAAVRASRESLGNIPVTIKLRSGWDSTSFNYAECARIAVEAGAAMVTLHPRTRAQNYGGRSDWSHITDLVSRLSVPVTGSGDLYTPEDAQQMLKETGCAAIMFARGAMGNPFIFSQTRSLLETGAWQPSPFSARIAAAMRHLEMLAADIGERTACLEMRKQFCAYTKGVIGGAALRDKVVRASTINEYRILLKKYNHTETRRHGDAEEGL
jgi:nifR3 family TIM-barrel protein